MRPDDTENMRIGSLPGALGTVGYGETRQAVFRGRQYEGRQFPDAAFYGSFKDLKRTGRGDGLIRLSGGAGPEWIGRVLAFGLVLGISERDVLTVLAEFNILHDSGFG
jgi:hypothetical protein